MFLQKKYRYSQRMKNNPIFQTMSGTCTVHLTKAVSLDCFSGCFELFLRQQSFRSGYFGPLLQIISPNAFHVKLHIEYRQTRLCTNMRKFQCTTMYDGTQSACTLSVQWVSFLLIIAQSLEKVSFLHKRGSTLPCCPLQNQQGIGHDDDRRRERRYGLLWSE